MLNSRDIGQLRADVAANCQKLIELAAEEGHPVLVTGTVRDEEYQMQCYRNGTSKSKVPTFHSVKAGLAFDICKNVKGEEYSDGAFWEAVSRIGKAMGFTWGGDWKMVDKPHFQWDGPNHEYTSGMILAGDYPPPMPRYGEEELTMTREELMSVAGTGDNPSEWAREAAEWAKEQGIFGGDGQGNYGWQQPITREAVAAVLMRLSEKY